MDPERAPTASAAPSSPEDVAALNDRLALEHPINAYYEKSPLPVRWIEGERLRIIAEMVAERPGLRILEVGSGGGHVLRMFRQSKLTAVDVSEVFLKTARENLAGYDVELRQGEIDKLGLPAASFDRIICTEVLEHTVDPDAILREIARLLRPDGWAVITVPNDPLINRVKKMVRLSPVGWVLRDRINWGGDHYHIHQWRPAEFQAVLARHFVVEERRSAPFDWLPVRVCFRCRPQG
jgi:2-polyprenyl-3-methyl-5-hydroxy-6-metoxy-1,4-benzoquinol methylase